MNLNGIFRIRSLVSELSFSVLVVGVSLTNVAIAAQWSNDTQIEPARVGGKVYILENLLPGKVEGIKRDEKLIVSYQSGPFIYTGTVAANELGYTEGCVDESHPVCVGDTVIASSPHFGHPRTKVVAVTQDAQALVEVKIGLTVYTWKSNLDDLASTK